jgi:CHAT domain-containing protein
VKHCFAARALVALAAALACRASERPQVTLESDSLVVLGDSLYARGQFDSARASWREALDQPGVAGTPAEARLLVWLGLAAMRLGEYPEARSLGELGLGLARRLNAAADLPQAQNALGLLAWQEGRLADAADLGREAVAGFQANGDANGVARASNNLGLVHYDLGRFGEARDAFLIARDAGRSLGDRRIEGRALTNLGMWEIWAGDPIRALEVLEEAKERARSAGDVLGLANALGQTAVAYNVLGQPGRALAAVDSALVVARAHGMREEEANDLVVAAGIYADAGDPDQALRAYADARRINQDLGLTIEAGTVFRDEATVRASRGLLDLARQNGLEALALHRRAAAHQEEFLDLLVLADIARRMKRLGEAEPLLGEARRLAAELGSAHARLSLGLAEARVAADAGNPRRTLRVLSLVQSDLRQSGAAAEAEWDAIRLRAWASMGRLDSAVVAGRRAVEAIERMRDGFASGPLRTSYVAEQSRVYADLVMALLRRGETDEAFAVADAARGRALLEHLSSARIGVDRSPMITDLAEADRLLRRIDQLLARLAQEEAVPRRERGVAHAAVSEELMTHLEGARREYRAYLVRAAERDPDRARLLGVHPAGGAEIRTALRADDMLLEYLITADQLFVFIMTRDTVRVVTHPVDKAQITHQVQLARELMVSLEARDRELAVTEALHDLLIAPARANNGLRGVRHLLIVPHGVLSYLPFASLRDPATGRILVEDLALSFLPTAAALPLLRARAGRARPASKAAGFAPFPSLLPSTETEVRTFQRAVPGASVRTGRQANEAAVRRALREGRMVHVATHGIMSARSPLFSRIVLARGRNGPADDGRLEVHELVSLSITSPLVFLSGCQTGLGSAWTTAFDHGEDFATLAQAFLYAGAGTVVATLWRIDDAGAAAFAERFYHHLSTRPPAHALAAAQRDLRSDSRWRSPYYWAGYTLSGVGPGDSAQFDRSAAVQTQPVSAPQ